MSVDSKMTAIADAIRDKTGGTEKLNLDDMAAGVGEVYNAGFEAGRNSGGGGDTEAAYNEGLEAGKQAEYDRFWDNHQQNGNRVNYEHAFGGLGWTNETFRPKYDIKPTHAYMLFRGAGIAGDLVEILDNLGVTLDFFNCANTQYMMANAKITRLGVVDLTNNASGADGMFASCYSLKTIDLLRVTEAQNDLDGMFSGCSSLENITFEGTIGNNCTLDSSTKLSKASIESVINHLSTTASGKTLTLSRTAVTNAFGSTTASAWTTLVNSKSNWTISLV